MDSREGHLLHDLNYNTQSQSQRSWKVNETPKKVRNHSLVDQFIKETYHPYQIVNNPII